MAGSVGGSFKLAWPRGLQACSEDTEDGIDREDDDVDEDKDHNDLKLWIVLQD